MNKLLGTIPFITLITISYSPASIAAIQCWQNNEGLRECSYTVPKKYLGREIKILNKRGQVIRIIPADKTPAEKKRAAELAKIAAEKKRLVEEQRRRDRILVNTFVSVEDILLSRDTKSTSIDSIIKITQSNRAKQQKILDLHTKRAGNFERKNLKVPKKIVANIEKSKAKIKEYDDFIESRRQEQLAIHLKYNADIARFKELKAIKPR